MENLLDIFHVQAAVLFGLQIIPVSSLHSNEEQKLEFASTCQTSNMTQNAFVKILTKQHKINLISLSRKMRKEDLHLGPCKELFVVIVKLKFKIL